MDFGKELLKHDNLAGDSSACCRLVAWEKDVDSLKVNGNCYQLKEVNIRQYKVTKYLSIDMECQIENIDDIGDVIDIKTQNYNSDALTLISYKTLISNSFFSGLVAI